MGWRSPLFWIKRTELLRGQQLTEEGRGHLSSVSTTIKKRNAFSKGRLEIHGKQILIFPDYSADLTRRRAAFNEVKVSLRQQEGVRYGLLYPARLRVSYNGETKVFNTPSDVKDYIGSRFGRNE
uniref:Uncharacterized protein n=1 Tax=Knipowitschia caucasica TaxID=637954 RepID=A0AAV2KF52_KNICA